LTVPSEKAPARPALAPLWMNQKPFALVALVAGMAVVVVTPVLLEMAFVGSFPSAKSVPVMLAGYEAAAPPVALCAYRIARTERSEPSAPRVEDADDRDDHDQLDERKAVGFFHHLP